MRSRQLPLAVFTAFLLAMIAAGCTADANLNIAVRLDDPCLLAFPACANDGAGVTYFCEDADGTVVSGCTIGCLAARDLYCDVDGPTCTQQLGPEGTTEVPVLCVSSSP